MFPQIQIDNENVRFEVGQIKFWPKHDDQYIMKISLRGISIYFRCVCVVVDVVVSMRKFTLEIIHCNNNDNL